MWRIDSPSAADDSEADEKRKEEKRASDRNGNYECLSQTFLLGLSFLTNMFYQKK